MTIRRSTSDVDLGFSVYDSEKYDSRPRVQILTPTPTPKRLQIRVCTKCNGQVTWIKEAQRFLCYSCGISYHEDFTSLPTSNDASIKPLQSMDPYEKTEPALFSFDPDKKDNEPKVETVWSDSTGRKKTIRIPKGMSPLAYNIREDIERSNKGDIY